MNVSGSRLFPLDGIILRIPDLLTAENYLFPAPYGKNFAGRRKIIDSCHSSTMAVLRGTLKD